MCVIVVGAYCYGVNVGNSKCRLQVAQNNLVTIQNYQNQIIKTQKVSHDTVYKMGVHDIRRVLCDKYSIRK